MPYAGQALACSSVSSSSWRAVSAWGSHGDGEQACRQANEAVCEQTVPAAKRTGCRMHGYTGWRPAVPPQRATHHMDCCQDGPPKLRQGRAKQGGCEQLAWQQDNNLAVSSLCTAFV